MYFVAVTVHQPEICITHHTYRTDVVLYLPIKLRLEKYIFTALTIKQTIGSSRYLYSREI